MGYVYFVRVTDVKPIESDEMEPHWFTLADVPYEHMWEGDRTWLPMLLEGKLLKGPIRFGPDNSHVEDMRLTEVDMSWKVNCWPVSIYILMNRV